jgi:perosamine synthetase
MQAEPTIVRPEDAVPLSQPYINGREVELVAEVLRSGQLGRGPMQDRFERMFADFVGARHAIAVSSGAAGLHVAAVAAGWGPDDEVIMSPFSVVGAASIARHTGANVTFADIDSRTLNVDPAAVEAAVTSRTRGIVPVDTFGWPADMDAIGAVATLHGLTVVEDASEALGARYRGSSIGQGSGWPTIFAFDSNGQLTTGDGGMLCTDDDAEAEEWRSLVDRGHVVGGQWIARDRLGCSFRLGDVASAIGVGQLEKLPRILAMRQQVAAEYTRLLADVPGVVTPLADGHGNVRSWFAYRILLDEDVDRADVMRRLAERRIECSPDLPSIHLQPAFREGTFPVAESIGARSLAIPFFPQMSPQQQERVVVELRDALAAV